MDNFAKIAFSQAQEETLQREAVAFREYVEKDGKKSELASLKDCGVKESALLIAVATEAGLRDTLKKYAWNMQMSGFHYGYEAGYTNGLEDAK